METGAYCREVESYLCRKNSGHLIRIVGPSFELVCGWAERKIPVRVVCAAIDRAVDRYRAKNQRRRTVSIEFCEADVLDLFDEWRRAVGVRAKRETENRQQPRLSLASHIVRVRERLKDWLEKGDFEEPISKHVRVLIDELEELRKEARTARGNARDRLLQILVEMDRKLAVVLYEASDRRLCQKFRSEAIHELEPFRQRMPPIVYQQALSSVIDRLLSDHYRLPRISFD